jgi:hypothetical protein
VIEAARRLAAPHRARQLREIGHCGQLREPRRAAPPDAASRLTIPGTSCHGCPFASARESATTVASLSWRQIESKAGKSRRRSAAANVAK